eukprot:CAMPEP_0195523994 /NCGR_PEP_ID=MMETSP0794_2-20130614/23555_1 /TAXON_ID=515487 /ORGANISM="Stephanopyxis turris, Strain CCMP 815" /LENGTH=794 /DNA_ID=CAMNT_0040654123 /DNA_START=498 /DNA_END=2882 /DNA_ORIENTATION=-
MNGGITGKWDSKLPDHAISSVDDGGGGNGNNNFPPPPSEEEDADDKNNNGKKEIHVFQSTPQNKKQIHTLAAMMTPPSSNGGNSIELHHHALNTQQQADFLKKYGSSCYTPPNNGISASTPNMVLERFEEMTEVNYQIELWKYCSLYLYGGIFLDGEGVLLRSLGDAFLSDEYINMRNVAPLSELYPRTIHGSILGLGRRGSKIAEKMVGILVETGNEELKRDSMLLSRNLYDLIKREVVNTSSNNSGEEEEEDGNVVPSLSVGDYKEQGWRILSQSCRFDPLEKAMNDVEEDEDSGKKKNWMAVVEGPKYHRKKQYCPTPNEYCCSISTSSPTPIPLFLTRHPLFPYRTIPDVSSLPQPYITTETQTTQKPAVFITDMPYISTIKTKSFSKPKEYPSTPNFFDVLMENDCLPSDKECSTCLRSKKGSNCEVCLDKCPCFCKMLCKMKPHAKFVSKHLVVSPPVYGREVDRIIPRIIHQTWFEPVTPESYPNMSRLIQSWKQSGWEYRFYDDDAIESFLTTHFPPEILEAFHNIKPGAFKADLFRYCVLLIHGGVYADMDVLLESNLDVAIKPNVGFLTPVDEPGTPVNHRMCLWNGLIAVAPAHPYMAKVIEIVVNNIRNRFTSVDVDNMLCDTQPELSISHAFDTLFTTGPCIFGIAVNAVLNRHLQTTFDSGDVPYDEKDVADADAVIPGRSVILRQNKQDMGAHRFTLVESNMVVAATDMPDYDDRQFIKKDAPEGDEGEKQEVVHYSKTHVKVGVYGLHGLYEDFTAANEDIKIIVRGDHPGQNKQSFS